MVDAMIGVTATGAPRMNLIRDPPFQISNAAAPVRAFRLALEKALAPNVRLERKMFQKETRPLGRVSHNLSDAAAASTSRVHMVTPADMTINAVMPAVVMRVDRDAGRVGRRVNSKRAVNAANHAANDAADQTADGTRGVCADICAVLHTVGHTLRMGGQRKRK